MKVHVKIGLIGLVILITCIVLDATSVIPCVFVPDGQYLSYPWYDDAMHLGGVLLILIGISGCEHEKQNPFD
jgi:arginine exporter protein ArgO